MEMMSCEEKVPELNPCTSTLKGLVEGASWGTFSGVFSCLFCML